jgi:UDP-3-O-[3-hydroxymyristoyl] glucosamine N-acyltransferase
MTKPLLTLEEIASIIGAIVEGDPSYVISGVADLERATPGDISFFSNPRYLQKMLSSKAGAVIVSPLCERSEKRNYLVHENPSQAFQTVLAVFSENTKQRSGFLGIHPTAVIHPTASVGQNVNIGPYAVVDQNTSIGDDSCIGSFVYIGPGSQIGKRACIHPHAVIRETCLIGDNVIIQPGAVIGSCGYGYVTDKEGRHHKLDQVGTVVIENDVEVGANTTIDRARFESTKIREGTKIDNLVQIAHNVEIGKYNLIVSQVGIAGSTILGNHVVLGGKVAVNGHIQICDNVRVTACSGISKSIHQSGDYGGMPAQSLTDYNRNMVYFRRVRELFDRVAKLEMIGKGSL